jgi:hypothetical protein
VTLNCVMPNQRTVISWYVINSLRNVRVLEFPLIVLHRRLLNGPRYYSLVLYIRLLEVTGAFILSGLRSSVSTSGEWNHAVIFSDDTAVQGTYMSRMILTVNRDCFPKQH